MGDVLRMAVQPSKGDPELVDALEKLLAAARRGEVIGAAYVVLKKGAKYEGDVLGSALHNPVTALGLSKALEHQLLKLLR